MSFAPFRTQAHSSAIFFFTSSFTASFFPFAVAKKKIGVTAAAAAAAAAASNISERTWEEAEDREASAKERRCQVKFALTEGERLASSCVRRRVRSTKCARGEGGLLKIFAAVNITRGERKKDFFLPVLSANYIYAHTQLTPSSRLCILMISPPPSCMEISLSHPSLDPLPPRFAQELRRYQPSSRHQAHPCLYIDSTSTTHQTNLSEQQSKSQNWRIRLFFSRSLWAGKKSSSLISLFFIRLLPMQLTSCFTFDSPPPSEQLELPTTCGPGIALDQDRDFCSWGLTTIS